MILTFTIEGPPVSWARSRHRGSAHFTPAKQRAYAAVVTAEALAARPRGWSLEGPFTLEIRACFKRSLVCKRHVRFHPTTLRHDIDNLAKLVMDGLNGIAFEDDGQVVALMVTKVCGPEAAVTVTVCPAVGLDAIYEAGAP